MRTKTFCLFTLLVLMVPILGDAQGWDRMHGMAILVTQQADIFILPGSVGFTSQGFEFCVYNWPTTIPVSTGSQDMMILYAGVPMFGAYFLRDGFLLAIIPSDETWRQNCRFLDGFVRNQVCDIRVSDSSDSRTIYLRNPPKE